MRTKRSGEAERGVLLGLAAEWREAAAALPARLRGVLRPPLFALADLESRHGLWDPDRGEIRLSRTFVAERGWDEVRDLLRHEMAHQLADQALGGGVEAPHGQAFREACRVLGAHPGASGRYVPLGVRLGGGDETRVRTLARLHKLLALASSRNRHEAELALLRAREFAARHRIGEAEEAAEEFLSAFAGAPALRHSRDEYLLAGLVTRFWSVFGIWVPSWVPERGRLGTALEVSGTPAQVKLAGYVHEFVRRHAAAEWQRFNRGRGLGARRRVDFACGVVEGFEATLARGRRGAGEGRRGALVPARRSPALEAYLRARYPRRSTIRRGGGSFDAGVHREGVRAGERLVLRDGIEAAPARRGRLLPSAR